MRDAVQSTGETSLMEQNVLVIEDDPSDLKVIRRAVEKCCAAHVVSVPTAHEAIAALDAAGANHFSVIFLDLGLPGLPGTEVVRSVRAAASMVPIVVVTASHQQADLYATYRLGANAFMVKAPDERAFAAEIETTVQFWLNINVLPRDRFSCA